MLTFQGREIPETLAEIVHPDHTVVMVHDMQNDNTGKGGKYERIGRRIDVTGIVPPTASFLARARGARARVMYTQYTNLPDFGSLPDTRIRDQFRLLQDPVQRDGLDALVDGTWGWQTIDELKPQPGETIIRKFRVDAFIGTPFEYLLRINRIRTLVHTGIATEVGILPTAWHALNMGFFVVVPEDCVDAMQKQYHGEAMAFLRRLAIVTTSAEIVAAWKTVGRA
ncbi:MAG TPA: isochorismatase family cysteine hydrolase [Methylomirabilota bacterium]|nr:isochorismatase family cysteine hydrolase [Methylomirabilota bacterium]